MQAWNKKNCNIQLPDWIDTILSTDSTFKTEHEQMSLVLNLAKENVLRKTGGPFAAALFDLESGELLAPGINLVTTLFSSVFHAEAISLILGQHLNQITSFAETPKKIRLVTSAQPCIQCLGMLHWAKVNELLYAAHAHDTESIGFNEGPIPNDWKNQIFPTKVTGGFLRDDALKIMTDYKNAGGKIY